MLNVIECIWDFTEQISSNVLMCGATAGCKSQQLWPPKVTVCIYVPETAVMSQLSNRLGWTGIHWGLLVCLLTEKNMEGFWWNF